MLTNRGVRRPRIRVEDTYAAAKPSGTYRGCEAYNDLR